MKLICKNLVTGQWLKNDKGFALVGAVPVNIFSKKICDIYRYKTLKKCQI